MGLLALAAAFALVAPLLHVPVHVAASAQPPREAGVRLKFKDALLVDANVSGPSMMDVGPPEEFYRLGPVDAHAASTTIFGPGHTPGTQRFDFSVDSGEHWSADGVALAQPIHTTYSMPMNGGASRRYSTQNCCGARGSAVAGLQDSEPPLSDFISFTSDGWTERGASTFSLTRCVCVRARARAFPCATHFLIPGPWRTQRWQASRRARSERDLDVERHSRARNQCDGGQSALSLSLSFCRSRRNALTVCVTYQVFNSPRVYPIVELPGGGWMAGVCIVWNGIEPHTSPDGPFPPLSIVSFRSDDGFNWKYTRCAPQARARARARVCVLTQLRFAALCTTFRKFRGRPLDRTSTIWPCWQTVSLSWR